MTNLLSQPWIRRALRRPARFIRQQVLPRVLVPARTQRLPSARQVRVVGLLSSSAGVGKSARLCAEALMRSGYGVSTADVADLFGSSDRIPFGAAEGAGAAPPGTSIYHLNPPMLLPGVIRAGLSRYYRCYNIGYWAWELERLPPEWIAALRFVDAVFVPSRFAQAAIQRHTHKPVCLVPHPVPARPARPEGWRAGRPFRVLNVFSFGSSFARKNPLALVAAFRLAFADDPDARLVLKMSHGARHPADMARLRHAVADMTNVEPIDEIWDEERLAALMRSADVYASLHRSEGFGLPIAEAIMAGVPVVATNWSGNVDFCPPDCTFPVDYTLIPFRDRHPDYDAVRDARWADPSVAHAAQQLRRIRDDPAAAHVKAQRARQALARHLAAHSYDSALASLRDEPVAARARSAAAARLDLAPGDGARLP